MTLKPSAAIQKDLLKKIPVRNRQRRFRIHRESVAFFCAALLQALNRAADAMSVAFVGNGEMRRINGCYRGKEYATDVLSFLYGGAVVDGAPFLGEIVIAPQVALEHSMSYGVPFDGELRKLLVHGTLHLLGYDHETDDGEMNRMQAKLLRRRFVHDAPPLAQMRET